MRNSLDSIDPIPCQLREFEEMHELAEINAHLPPRQFRIPSYRDALEQRVVEHIKQRQIRQARARTLSKLEMGELVVDFNGNHEVEVAAEAKPKEQKAEGCGFMLGDRVRDRFSGTEFVVNQITWGTASGRVILNLDSGMHYADECELVERPASEAP